MEALLLIDIQKDFLPGGSLAVEQGDKIIPVVNKLQEDFELIVATQDWHPPNHGSFASNHQGKSPGDKIKLQGTDQVLWPDHCVQDSEGATFADDLNMANVQHVIRKGTDPKVDSYSGFYDNEHKKATGLHDFLKKKNVDTVYLTGLATDVCVRFTALDALELGYKTILVKDATKAVDGDKGYQQTLAELNKKGVKILTSNEI